MEYLHKFNISGRGLVYVVKTFDCKIGDTVEIDGEMFTIRGIESQWKWMAPPITGSEIGLIVRPLKKEETDV